MSRSKRPLGDYDVGYCRPPVSGRYKPGDIGNPRGRRKKKKPIGETIEDAMMTRIKIEENGRSRTVTAQDVIILNLVRAAARGDIRATHAVFALRDRYQDSTETALNPADLDSEDRRIIDEHLARLRGNGTGTDAQGPHSGNDQGSEENPTGDGKTDDAPDKSGGDNS